jgi:hypothetical protein
LTQAEAANDPGSLRLQDAAGEYNVTLAIASNFVSNEGTVDVHFKSVPTTGKYSLTYIAGDGKEWTFFRNAPFNTLQDDSLPDA